VERESAAVGNGGLLLRVAPGALPSSELSVWRREWYTSHDTKGKWASKRKPRDGLVWHGDYKNGLIRLQITLDKQ